MTPSNFGVPNEFVIFKLFLVIGLFFESDSYQTDNKNG